MPGGSPPSSNTPAGLSAVVDLCMLAPSVTSMPTPATPAGGSVPAVVMWPQIMAVAGMRAMSRASVLPVSSTVRLCATKPVRATVTV